MLERHTSDGPNLPMMSLTIPGVVTKGSSYYPDDSVSLVLTKQSNPIFSQENLTYDDGPSKPSLVAVGSAVQKLY